MRCSKRCALLVFSLVWLTFVLACGGVGKRPPADSTTAPGPKSDPTPRPPPPTPTTPESQPAPQTQPTPQAEPTPRLAPNQVYIRKADFGEDWPFTVDHG